MNILLVKPPTPLKVAKRLEGFLRLEPLAIEIVAGGIDIKKHNTEILDLSVGTRADKLFISHLKRFKPDVIGFTGYSNQASKIKQLSQIAKSQIKNVFVMVGGVHATIAPNDFNLPNIIDLVVRGEGGSVMPQLIECLEKKQPIPESPVFLLTGSSNFSSLADTLPPALPDFKDIPLPRRDLIKACDYYCIQYAGKGQSLDNLFPVTTTVRTSVGCPNHCNFCVVHFLANGKYVQRTPEDVVDEISSIESNHIYFVDDEMFINAKRTETIARLLIERKIRKKYVSWARADTICKHPELFRLWKEAGLTLLYVGLESMEAEILESYNKGIEPSTNLKAVEILNKLEIGLHAALMVHPNFTESDFTKLKKAMKLLTPSEITFTVFSPPPGTDLWKQYSDKFICSDPYTFYDCMHTLIPTKIPIKKFYRNFAFLYLLSFRNNPWRLNRVKVPFKDFSRFMWRGILYGSALRNIVADYKTKSM
jgi:hopanoid C-3 methylase